MPDPTAPEDLFDDLTGSDLEELENLCDQSLGEIFDAFETNAFRARHLKALMFLTKRKEDPALEWDSYEWSVGEMGAMFSPPA